MVVLNSKKLLPIGWTFYEKDLKISLHLKEMGNQFKMQSTEFIPIYGYFKYCQRRAGLGEARADAFVNDIKHKNFYEADIKNPITNRINKVAFGYSEPNFNNELRELGLILYHATTFIGLALSPAILRGLENLIK